MISCVFVRGISPRCGTNYLGDILSHHPDVSPYPQRFWEFAPFRYHDAFEGYLNLIESCVHIEGFSPKEFLPHFGNAWLSYFHAEHLKVPMFKEPSVAKLGGMFDMFPSSKAIIITRDGRDIISSQLKSGYGLPSLSIRHPSTLRRLLPGHDFKILVNQLKKSVEALQNFLNSTESKDLEERFTMVKYEHLFAEPRREIPRFLGSWNGLVLTL